MTRRDDADEIIQGLESQLESVLDALSPGWVENPRRPGLAFLTPSGKDLGSFQVHLRERGKFDRGSWRRWSIGVGGGVLKLVAYLLSGNSDPSKQDYADAFEWGRRFLGLSDRRESDDERQRRSERQRQERAERQQRERAAAVEDERRRVRRAGTAADIWEECRPIAGTLAERYLIGRGIPPPADGWPAVVGFHDSLEWEIGSEWNGDRKIKEGPRLPCLVGRVQDIRGDTTAVWRVFLDRETGSKATLEPNKLGLGPAVGGAIRIGGLAPKIGVAEGIETAFGAWFLVRQKFPVWSVLSTAGMEGFEPPLSIERGTTFPDGDRPYRKQGDIYVAAKPPGRKAARVLRERMAAIGIHWTTEAEPSMWQDYLDLWNQVNDARER